MTGTRVGIIGVGQSAFQPRRNDANYPELVREAVNLCFADAKLGFDDIEIELVEILLQTSLLENVAGNP